MNNINETDYISISVYGYVIETATFTVIVSLLRILQYWISESPFSFMFNHTLNTNTLT